jgi:CheY-like chemotaxis protein
LLIAEDNEINRKILARILTDYKCIFAANGLEAFEQYQINSESIDLIFMDIEMPLMNGKEATKKIREYEQQHPQLKKMPIIALSGNALEAQRQEALNAGMDDYITKPYHPKLILEKLRNILNQNKEQLISSHGKFFK